MLNLAYFSIGLAMIVFCFGLLFLCYLAFKIIVTDIVLFLNRRANYKFAQTLKELEAKNASKMRHPSNQNKYKMEA